MLSPENAPRQYGLNHLQQQLRPGVQVAQRYALVVADEAPLVSETMVRRKLP
jgi:hypothetical protein